jgi:hypothetical protein
MQGEEEVQPLRGMGHTPEDILFCVDADAEVSVEMKLGTQGKGLCRLDAIKQAIILFVHSKLMAHAHHRFAFATLRNSASWVRGRADVTWAGFRVSNANCSITVVLYVQPLIWHD